MAKHYSHNNMLKKGKSYSPQKMKNYGSKRMAKGRKHKMMLPRDTAGMMAGVETQLYHEGPEYYGPGFGSIANMPQYVDLHYYPKEKSYLMTDKYPDTLMEIDSDSTSNMGNLKSQPSTSKY